jgi:hypothetical protein
MRIVALVLAVLAVSIVPAAARTSGDPIRVVWTEGDVAGTTTIYGPDRREQIGFVEYHQTRHGDRLSTVRVARFRDGSSDEDQAEARIGDTLEALSGRSLIRDPDGEVAVDLEIDVAGGRVRASWGHGDERHTSDEAMALPRGTYWGPLVFLVLKNFAANAEDGRVVFRTVAPTPRPMAIDMEIVREGDASIERLGMKLATTSFRLSPTVHWTIDPLVRMIAPRARFWILPGDPPALARFDGPRNYARQEVVIE